MKKILIKISGESFANKQKSLAIDPQITNDFSRQISEIIKQKIQVAIVVGGGNFWRGNSAEKNGIPRNRADYIGMLATIMNALALQSALELQGTKVKVQSSLNVDSKVAENYINEKAKKALENYEVVIFSGGTGRPFFTTDTAATLVSSELDIKTILMGKNGVDGVYDKDPNLFKDAKRFETITYKEVIKQNLKVMDITAATMADENKIELIIFDICKPNAIIKAINKDLKHTIVKRG